LNIVFFDFDGTITTADMYSKFLRFSASKRRAYIVNVALVPFLILYKIGLISAHRMRSIASFAAFGGRPVDVVTMTAKQYVDDVIPHFLREKALDQLAWHKHKGDKIVIVSASLNVYLRIWCAQHNVELICTELAVKNNKFTGFCVNGDCSSNKKLEMIRNKYDLTDYNEVYAYGDTKEDADMLRIADHAYYNWKPFSKD